MDAAELKKILADHAAWMRSFGTEGQHANLQHANLQHADLRGAYLHGANLRGANLQHAYLQHANLQHANLQDANLQDAYLQHAYLRGANLRGANLQDADLRGANLQDADLRHAKGAQPFRWQIAPQSGAFDIFKKVLTLDGERRVILHLRVSADAGRVNAPGSRKIRVEAADVIGVFGARDEDAMFMSRHDSDFRYPRRGMVRARNFDPSPFVECSGGIHGFLTREEAEEWQI